MGKGSEGNVVVEKLRKGVENRDELAVNCSAWPLQLLTIC